MVWSAKDDPFGNVHASTGTPATIRFPGQWFQSESGLHQNWMRHSPTKSPLFFRVRACIVRPMTREPHIAHRAGGFALIATRGLLLLTLL